MSKSILVSNPSKIYTHQTVAALQKQWDILFFTSFWYKPDHFFFKIIATCFPSFKKQLQKRSSPLFPSSVVYSNFLGSLLFFFGRFFWSTEKRNFIEDKWHDYWVSRRLNQWSPDIIIGYEKSCLHSFQKAKTANKITILDLAQVHPQFIQSLRNNFSFFSAITGNEKLFDRISKKKEGEYELADHILVLSSFAKQTLTENGIDENKISIVNLGFDVSKFQLKEYINDFSQKLKLVFVGTITQRKGIHLFKEVKQKFPLLDFDITFIGSKDDGLHFIQTENGFNYIPFLHHNALIKELHKADVFVLPSYLDSWAMVVIEAMACGLPVIISENTGAKDAVTKDCGFVIPIDDVDALVNAIQYFIDNRMEVERMGKAARLQAEQYTWDHYSNQLNTIVNQLITKKTKTNLK